MYQVKMFSYGTLQREGSLYEIIRPAVLSAEPAVLEGYGLYRSRWGIYPEAFPLKGHSIKGTLFEVDANGLTFIETVMMEIRAGYKLEMNEVVTSHGMLINALTFIYREQPTGYLIEDGNWIRHAKYLQNSKI
jgi:gamma-glutamylcyclotransferase (GGCT)/AIG2-like uncharacterized protein YtfP